MEKTKKTNEETQVAKTTEIDLDKLLDKLLEITKDDVETQAPVKTPVLKINYDPDSMYKRGTWIVGQEKDGHSIISEGKEVDFIAIVKVRRMYSLYVEKDTSKNCSSPLFVNGENTADLVGNNHGYHCSRKGECPYRTDEMEVKCGNKWVVYCVTFTKDGDSIPCVAYFGGTAYMPFSNFYDKITKVAQNGVYKTVVPYLRKVHLSSQKVENYFVPVFQIGDWFDIATVAKLKETSLAFDEIINYINSKHHKRTQNLQKDIETTTNNEQNIYALEDNSDDEEETENTPDNSNTKAEIETKKEEKILDDDDIVDVDLDAEIAKILKGGKA